MTVDVGLVGGVDRRDAVCLVVAIPIRSPCEVLFCCLLYNVQSTRRVLVPTQGVALSHAETLLRAHRPACLDQVHDSVLVKVSLVVGVQIEAFTNSIHQVVLSTTSFCQFDRLRGAFSDLGALLGARICVHLGKWILMIDQLRWT